MSKKAIVLSSGGVDSTTCLSVAIYEGGETPCGTCGTCEHALIEQWLLN